MFETLKKFIEGICSKLGEKLADFVVDTGKGVMELGDELQHLKKNLENLSFVASDIEDRIKSEELPGKRKRKREVENWLKMVQQIKKDLATFENEIQGNGVIKRHLSGNRVAELNARIKKLVDQSRDFGGLVHDDNESRGVTLLPSKLSGESVNEILGSIWKCLVVDKVRIIGIYGESGVGKTTLAMHIHNRVLEQTEDRVYWARVSKKFSITNWQDDIAKALGITLSHENDEDKRAAELNQALRQRKGCVLILDDLSEDIDLRSVGDPLEVDGCRLIITTRTLKVCRRIECQKNFEMTMLDEDEAWNLFKETFGQDIASLETKVQDIAKSMVRKQGGLPQRIVMWSRRMRGVTEIREWRNALAEVEEILTREGDEMEAENFGVLSNA